MFKRISSLILVLTVGSSVFAGTVRLQAEHVCKMTGMPMVPNMEHVGGMRMSTAREISGAESPDMEEMSPMESCGMENMSHSEMSDRDTPDMDSMPGMDMADMETMPCCWKDQIEAATEMSGNSGLCCVTVPQEPGSTATTVSPRFSSYSIVITHPAVMQLPLSLPKPSGRPPVRQLFLPNLQATYVRNLAFLI